MSIVEKSATPHMEVAVHSKFGNAAFWDQPETIFAELVPIKWALKSCLFPLQAVDLARSMVLAREKLVHGECR